MCILCNNAKKHFPGSLKIDDYLARVEILLSKFGFDGKNSIAMMNVCRDESTHGLKKMVEQVYGASFTTTGLGGVLTCGQTGIAAGLSHSPVCNTDKKERYVFFSYPHIGVHPDIGQIPRKGRVDHGTACGALIKCMHDLRKEGLADNKKTPGVHDPVDIEYSILKQRMARTICAEGLDPRVMDLADVTKVAEKRITQDLETLIRETVDTKKADYAVFTGVQIHAWKKPDAYYKNEYIWPRKSYACIDGKRTELDLSSTAGLSRRQIEMIF